MNCPYLMNDGRHITNYKSNKYINSELKYHYNINNNNYRTFLKNNGLSIIRDINEKNKNNCKNLNFGNCYTNAYIDYCDDNFCTSFFSSKCL
jgi:hypothetical protein